MPNVNKCFLMGHVTRDPETKQISTTFSVCEFGLAITRRWKSPQGDTKAETCFIDCSAFGKSGEAISQYVKKGDPIYVEGRLRYESWDDKTTGKKRSKLGVVVEQFQFLRPIEERTEKADMSKSPVVAPKQQYSEDEIPF